MRLALLALGLCAQDTRTFTCKEGNYTVTYPKAWKKGQPPVDNIQLLLTKGTYVIMASGLETKATPESLADETAEGWRMLADSFKELSRREVKVRDERAIALRVEFKQSGVRAQAVAVLFTHQGIAYRILGLVPGGGDFEPFAEEFDAILRSLEFIEDRKEWLAKFEGKPARTALLGGLATLELNRPRWTESFEDARGWGLADSAKFEFIGGFAWVTVEARESAATAAEELESLKHALSARVQKASALGAAVAGAKGDIATVEIAGVHEEVPWRFRAAAFVADGMALRIWMEGAETQAGVTKKDWEQLVKGIELHARSKAPEPPAWVPERARWRGRPDPGLAAWIDRAARLGGPHDDVHHVAPDGQRAIVEADDALYVHVFATGKREALRAPGAAAWSADGRRVAVIEEGVLRVGTLADGKNRVVPVEAAAVAFAGEDALLACVPVGKAGCSRLESVALSDSSRKTLVDFPLSRVELPTPSPDGKRVALVCNRDIPRTLSTGGNVYVLDGELRRITKDPEEVSSLAWSADGKALYAVRRLAAGEDGAVGPGGSSDLWRIPLDGAPVNLTRSGHVGKAWIAGGDAFVWVSGWSLPESQEGLFRIGLAELEKATASRPVPVVPDMKAQAKAVAERVRKALGGTAAKDAVPTKELMEKLAGAFAESASKACGVTLDFSAGSLDALSGLTGLLLAGREREVLLGFGAYYGETLRRAGGAEWVLQPAPFGEWMPGEAPSETPLARAVLPFSEPVWVAGGSEIHGMLSADDVASGEQGPKLLLVYPASSAAEAVRAAAGKEYYEARALLDKGEVKPALEILVKELKARPRNRALALELIRLCESAGLPDAAQNLARQAVEGGNRVPDLLLRYADEIAESDPKGAMEALRKAVAGDWAPAEAYLKLGAAYEAAGKRPIAESCWRRAWHAGSDEVKADVLKRLGIEEAPK